LEEIMSTIVASIVFTCLSTMPMRIQLGVQKPPQSASIVPMELKGLKSVLLNVYVDPYISGSKEIEEHVEANATELLTKAGLSLDNKQRGTLSIEVDLHPIRLPLFAEYSTVQVRIRLIEDVRLLRKPSIKTPIAADIWEWDVTDVMARSDIEKYIIEETENLIKLFLSNLKTAEGRY
jgi:hypothetical protein